MPASRADVVDPELADYIAAHSSHPDEVQRRLMSVTVERTGGSARMQIGGDQGTMFEMLTRAIGVRSAIEIGTFTGYSALSIARGLAPGGRLICCDVSEEWTAIAREHWELAGVADRIDLRIGPALETIAALDPSLVFDLAFIDADKTNYANYFEALLPPACRPPRSSWSTTRCGRAACSTTTTPNATRWRCASSTRWWPPTRACRA